MEAAFWTRCSTTFCPEVKDRAKVPSLWNTFGDTGRFGAVGSESIPEA